MSDDSKSFEKKLDRDFLVYLNLTKDLFDNIKDETEKNVCEVWLTHLVGKTICSIGEKCDRNIFLSRLLLQMQNGKLKDIFLDTPPSGTLPCAFTTFQFPTEVDGLKGFEEMGFQVDASIGGGSGDFFESSRDGRTYLATRSFPEGMMAFMAVTNNEGEEIWKPQQCPFGASISTQNGLDSSTQGTGEFVKKLAQFVGVPISQLRRSQAERERVLEWMDKIISDCNKWLQGEDPHNMDLEALFEILYQDYQKDPEAAEFLKHPKNLRNILIKDIRERVSERRAEVTKRELVLDQYEADEYVEERLPGEVLDDVWLECARKPMNDTVRQGLEAIYPPEVVQRFNELLYQERLQIIEKGEKEANKKIAELRSGSLDDIKKETSRLKKVQQEYREYYCIYKEVEAKYEEFEKERKEKCAKSDKSDQQQNIEQVKREIEFEIEQAKSRFEKERRTQHEITEKLEEAKEAYATLKERMAREAEKLNCERHQLQVQKQDLICQIKSLRKRRDELSHKAALKKNNCSKFK